ncbi:MAG TPA: hypothetical protein VMX58_02850 [Patescibacteria group bacterium]|nr:hypothetical protein [Patescibacteria group bacterium]
MYRTDGEGSLLWIEAESARYVLEPIEISSDTEASGGACIAIKQGAGTGMTGAGGEAMYDIDIPEPGQYVLWARVYWLDGCSNSFFVDIGGKNYHFGEDSNFHRWHWIRFMLPGFESSGRKEMIIRNREDGISIDKLLVTKKLDYIPQGMGGNRFVYFFEDGLPSGWRPKTEHYWEIAGGKGVNGSSAYHLRALGGATDEYSVGIEVGESYAFQCIVKSLHEDRRERNFRVLLNYRNERDYCCLDCNDGLFSFLKVSGQGVDTLSRTDTHVESMIEIDGEFHFVEIQVSIHSVTVEFDGHPVLRVDKPGLGGGRIGLGSRAGDVLFDNVVIAGDLEINYAQNFYYDIEGALSKVAGWLPVAGSWARCVSYGTLAYEVEANWIAATVSGSLEWRNYSFESAMKGDGSTGIGLLFYYANTSNYYLLRWGGKSSPPEYAGRIQLVRIVDRNMRILDEHDGGYEPGQWYRMRVDLLDGSIRAFVDDDCVFDLYADGLFQGFVGLYAESSPSGGGGRPTVELWPGLYGGTEWRAFFPIHIDRETSQGIFFCYQDELNYYLLERTGYGEGKDRSLLRLYEVIEGNATLLQKKDDMLEFPRSYGIGVEKNSDGVSIKIMKPQQETLGDIRTVEAERFFVAQPKLRSGKIAVSGGRTINAAFDDIFVRSVNDFRDSFDGEDGTRPLEWRRIDGDWTIHGGKLTAGSDSVGYIVTGDRSWKDYTYSVECTGGGPRTDSFGLCFYRQGEDRYYCVRGSGPRGGAVVTLLKVKEGVETILAESKIRDASGLFTVELDDGWIGVHHGDSLCLGAFDREYRSGGIGLYSSGGGAIAFDDVDVRFGTGRRAHECVNTIFEIRRAGSDWRTDFNGWIGRAGAWHVVDGALQNEQADDSSGVWWKQGYIAGDFTVMFHVVPQAMTGGYAAAVIRENEAESGRGYELRLMEEEYVCFRDGERIISGNRRVLEPGRVSSVAFEKRRGHILATVNGEQLFSARDEAPLRGGNVGLVVKGGIFGFGNITVLSYPAYCYEFSLEKWAARDFSNWRIASGVWNERSAIVYGMYGEKDTSEEALLWHKKPLPRDVAFEFFFSPLAYSDGGSFFVGIGCDGEDIRSGYSIDFEYEVHGKPGEAPSFRIAATLKRGGLIVERDEIALPHIGSWVKARIEKTGRILKLFIAERKVMAFRDDAPPRGNMAAIGVAGEIAHPVFFDNIVITDLTFF